MRRAAAVLFCCLALLGQHRGAQALYSTSGKVKLVDPQRFGKSVLGSQIPSVVEFFAPWRAPASADCFSCILTCPRVHGLP